MWSWRHCASASTEADGEDTPMADSSLAFPTFFPGQYLGDADLNALADYIRASVARHGLGQHTWGIVVGLGLTEEPVADDQVDIYVQPGVAVDGYGRVIVVTEPVRVEPSLLVGNPHVGGSGEVPLWLRYAETPQSGVRPGFEVCDAEDAYSRAAEGFALEAGARDALAERQDGIQVGPRAVVDARAALNAMDPAAPLICDGSVPHQALPAAADALWLVPLGLVAWVAATTSFASARPEQRIRGRVRRRYAGCVAEQVLAADGLLRLGGRTTDVVAGIPNDAVCADGAPGSGDFLVCDDRVQALEPIWLEAHTRVTGDLRLFGGQLELRNGLDTDWQCSADAGAAAPDPAIPLAIRRGCGNARGGVDLLVLLGQTGDGRNRLSIGAAVPAPAQPDPCSARLDAGAGRRVLIRDDGRVGVGMTVPGAALDAPLTIRALDDQIVLQPGTPDEETLDVQRVLAAEASDGTLRWRLDLWPEDDALSFNEAGAPNGDNRLLLAAGGNVGIGTAAPDARLDIRAAGNVEPWLSVGAGGDSGRVWIEYRDAAPHLVLSDMDDPPRLRFQQTGSAERAGDMSPSHESWIGHARRNSPDLTIGGGHLGIGTEAPSAPLTVLANAGSVHLISDRNGGHVWIGLWTNGANAGRSGRIGYNSNGATDLELSNELPGGDIVLSPDRNVGIGTRSPNAELDVRGNVRFGSSGELHAVGSRDEPLRVLRGTVSAGGLLQSGPGWTLFHAAGSGLYTITFSPGFADAPTVVATPIDDIDTVVSVTAVGSGGCTVRTQDVEANGEGPGPDDVGFSFIAIGGR
jgi:hypothetical protein